MGWKYDARMQRVLVVLVAACGSPRASPSAPAAAAPAPADAAVDSAPPDAGASAAVLAAPAWIFRYNAPPRVETWTLRVADGEALLDVDSGTSTIHYTGTAEQGASLKVSVATSTAKLALDCKHASRAIGPTCTGKKPPASDVLDCFHPDFASPMTFAPAPGVEYSAACNGYRRLP
jgi:hypothetical protein